MAKASAWKSRIKKACNEAGTYQPYFDSVIQTLAEILENRDKAYEQFIKSGANSIIKYTNKAGATNPAKNPLMIVWDELNKTALTYWKELGLTPSGLRRINENALTVNKKRSALDLALSELG